MTPLEIKSIRLGLNMDQIEFSTLLVTSVTTVSRWETGVSEPRPVFIEKLEALKEELNNAAL